jgi:hypothetical protein
VTLRVRNMSGASGSPPAKHSKKEDEPKESPPPKEPKEKSRTVPALSAPVIPALLKAKSSMFLSHIVDHLTKYCTSVLLPGIKTLGTKYSGKHKGAKLGDVLQDLLKEVPQYRNLLLPEDEGKTLLDEHVDSLLKRVPDLESLIQHTLQFRSLLISSDQGNAVDINLTIPATREFLDKVFVNVAEEFEDDPEGSWLHARPQEVRSIVAASIKQTIDSYLPYAKKQLDAITAIDGGDAEVVEKVIEEKEHEEEAESDPEEKQKDKKRKTIRISRQALKRKSNPTPPASDAGSGSDAGSDNFASDDSF